ncbi:acetolactate synthase catalytic subunit [Roseococcus pinisoli]|uniref:Acetolactate synthase catalytic subunit n=1 Tax=Roseococcus pinisoli TaxID=2835040 RepID=A0ABS5QIV2_9PROT|nr:acetolactate synthase catalytic subunit [Roseococcus pinisoli]MBS7813616.1 acetolactate synthase catalytic subunit [Roseococcus pinisoli]
MPDAATPQAVVHNATVAMRLAEAFARHGVTVTFGQSLPSAFHLATPAAGIRQAVYRTENMGGIMADGYARISGRVGVVTAQNGPAAALLVAPLAEAYKASIPVVALVQEVNRDQMDRNAFQELDHLRLFDPVSKWVRRIERADRLEDYVDMAFAAATSGRPGPAVLLAPADLLTENAAKPSPRQASLGIYPLDRYVPAADLVEKAAEMLAGAERPLILAGGGIHSSDASAALAALQEKAGLPVGTTVMGKGAADEGHPLTLGIIGYVMSPGARTHRLRAMVEGADVVLLVGTRTNANGTDNWTMFKPGTRFIHIDPDPQEIGRNYEALRLTGDARLTLEALGAALEKRDLGKRRAARPAIEATIAAAVADWKTRIQDVFTREGRLVRPERIMAELDRRIDGEAIVVADASYSSMWVGQYLTAKRAGQRFLTPRGIAGLGWGLPLAIGAQVAAPDRRVVCLVGDGGFGHSWSELEMLRRMELPVTVIVLNNSILGYQKHAELVKFKEHTDAVDFTDVDHTLVARACGVANLRVTEAAEVGPALDEAFSARRPMLIDVLSDPEARPPINYYAGHFEEPY